MRCGAGRAVTRTHRSNAGTRVEPLGAMRSDPARESEHAGRPWHGLRLGLARSSCDEVKDMLHLIRRKDGDLPTTKT